MFTFINGSGVDSGVVFHRIDFLSLDGAVIETLPLELVDHSALYNTTFMMPPEDFFHIQVSLPLW